MTYNHYFCTLQRPQIKLKLSVVDTLNKLLWCIPWYKECLVECGWDSHEDSGGLSLKWSKNICISILFSYTSQKYVCITLSFMQALQLLVLNTAAQNEKNTVGFRTVAELQKWMLGSGKNSINIYHQRLEVFRVHSMQILKCRVKDGWPINKGIGRDQWQQRPSLLSGVRSQPSSTKLALCSQRSVGTWAQRDIQAWIRHLLFLI